MDGVDGGGSGSNGGDPLATAGEGGAAGGGGGGSGGGGVAMPAVSTVYVTIPQTAVVSASGKGIL
ncbi:hypothetical protein SK128_006498 [Halocaridina rubra]|uniref:Uncharacterized protein n=1 Tax=Halocaridina rubra TaxID=373956 RepID=A0AAN9FUY9_HALRR